MRACTPAEGEFVDWSCDVHSLPAAGGASEAWTRSWQRTGGDAGGTSVLLLVVLGVALGGALSFALFKLRGTERNLRTKLRDGPDTPGPEIELDSRRMRISRRINAIPEHEPGPEHEE
jgi:hypothetical protein